MISASAGGPDRCDFSSAWLDARLVTCFEIVHETPLAVAFSGGLDSTVLLHALHDAGRPLRALHVDHGLHARSGDWAAHCERVCARWQVPCLVLRVQVTRRAQQSLEAVARQARYRALAGVLAPGEVLLSAHHENDQAETVLLMLLRGAGAAGLAAMPAGTSLGGGRLLRPLLGTSRVALRRYADRHALRWQEDPANRALCHDRNYLRQEVLPGLARRWPGVGGALARSAHHLAQASGLLDELAAQDLRGCVRPPVGAWPGPGQSLSVRRVEALSRARRRNLLRYWIAQAGLPPPPARALREALDQLFARPSTTARLSWRGGEMSRYRNRIFLRRPSPVPGPGSELSWNPARALAIAPLQVRLVAARVAGAGIAERWMAQGLAVRWRRGGERCRLPGRAHRSTLKNLFQARGVPSWERQRLPLIFIDDQLAAVSNLCACAPFAATPDEPGRAIRIEALEILPPGQPREE